jgi:hypothetical protein
MSQAPTATTPASWVARSNQNAQVLLQAIASLNPEAAGELGVEGLDEQIIDLKPGFRDRREQATSNAIRVLEGRVAPEKDAKVRQDLEILIKAAKDELRSTQLEEKYQIPYINVAQVIFGGVRGLLNDQVDAPRRKAALVRLKRYVGLESDYTPLTVLAQQHTRQYLSRTGLIGPSKVEVEKDLANMTFIVKGIGELFEKYQISGYQQAYAKLSEQLAAYDEFLRQEVLPKARTDFRQPPELYAFSLERNGVDIPPEELAQRAHAAFKDIQQQMQALSPKVAKEKSLTVSDYRDVIRALKQEQLIGEAILPHYRQRIKEIEAIIQRERLVTLPEREMKIQLASAAESAITPAPHFRPPRLLGNTGEMGEFILPLSVPGPAGSQSGITQKFDDFTFPAISWTLTAHEGRPGHEMQFASMIERGVSAARAIFAANSVNVEGWALYAEAMIKPYMPLDGQLGVLQFQLLRAARAFLDPELQMGKVTPKEALRILKEDVVLSDAFANQEVERYTFRAPGQATTYFYGYTQLMELRADAQKALGAKFDSVNYPHSPVRGVWASSFIARCPFTLRLSGLTQAPLAGTGFPPPISSIRMPSVLMFDAAFPSRS